MYVCLFLLITPFLFFSSFFGVVGGGGGGGGVGRVEGW